MLKIPKGLKKKKKGKKGKHKDDELFDPAELAELEQYRKEKQQKLAEASKAGTSEQPGEPQSAEGNEEWEKFKALTSGVDDILKKTQGDLDRIKSTSFFQKKPPGPSGSSEVVAKPVKPAEAVKATKWVGFEEGASNVADAADVTIDVSEPTQSCNQFEPEKVEEEEEEESEFEDDGDDLFDTSYVDVVTSGEIKLAFVPDSPEKEDDFDPFDTSIVDKVIKFDPQEEKRKKLVSLGCAVEVLTGKLDKPVEVPPEIVKTQRRRPRPRDLLLGSFDEGPVVTVDSEVEAELVPKSILDDDPVYAEETSEILGLPPVTPITDVKSISGPLPAFKVKESPKGPSIDLKTLVEEFVPNFCSGSLADSSVAPVFNDIDEFDDEFAALAAESLQKNEKARPPKPPPPQIPAQVNIEERLSDDDFNVEGDDPFDTSFAAQVLPGKFELKLIEKEILTKDTHTLTNTETKIQTVLSNSELTTLKPIHKDLLGGSTTDLSALGQLPIAPKSLDDLDSTFSLDGDPFDTSVVEKVVAPGKTELKFLEQELLSAPKSEIKLDDDEFDPRAEEKNGKGPPRPDNLLVPGKKALISKVVAFKVDSPADLLAVNQEENSKVSKPLTPYYPLQSTDQVKATEGADPFDTSYVGEASKPGKLEVQILEQELASTHEVVKRDLCDSQFDPRNAETITNALNSHAPQHSSHDILSRDVIEELKLHTPVVPQKAFSDALQQDIDPFDTSIAGDLIPGKAEIKLLETELIYTQTPSVTNPVNRITEELLKKNTSSLKTRKPSVDLVLEQDSKEITVKPLTPVTAGSFDLDDSIDPFDTSAVENIVPGKTEIKLLESELLS